MSIAPVCQIPTKTPIPQPPAVSNVPAIPVPEPNMGSIMNTLQQLKKAVEALQGLQGAHLQGSVKPSNKKKKDQQGRWVEISRDHGVVRIFNPADNEQYVDVDRINKLVYQDSVTGEIWTWTR